MKKYKIGIIGGAGYIGFNIAKHLANDFYIKILDTKSPKYLEKDMEYIRYDIRDYNMVEKSLANIDLVIHTAIIQIFIINEKKGLAMK